VCTEARGRAGSMLVPGSRGKSRAPRHWDHRNNCMHEPGEVHAGQESGLTAARDPQHRDVLGIDLRLSAEPFERAGEILKRDVFELLG
jgi:hypothetical protein